MEGTEEVCLHPHIKHRALGCYCGIQKPCSFPKILLGYYINSTQSSKSSLACWFSTPDGVPLNEVSRAYEAPTHKASQGSHSSLFDNAKIQGSRQSMAIIVEGPAAVEIAPAVETTLIVDLET